MVIHQNANRNWEHLLIRLHLILKTDMQTAGLTMPLKTPKYKVAVGLVYNQEQKIFCLGLLDAGSNVHDGDGDDDDADSCCCMLG